MSKQKQILGGAAKTRLWAGSIIAIMFFLPSVAFADYTIVSNSGTATTSTFNTPLYAFPFSTTDEGYVTQVDMLLSESADLTYPNKSVFAQIWTESNTFPGESAGVPSTAVLASTITGSCASASVSSFYFDVPVYVLPNTEYYVVLTDRPLVQTPFFVFCGDTTPTTNQRYNGTSWSTGAHGEASMTIYIEDVSVSGGSGVSTSTLYEVSNTPQAIYSGLLFFFLFMIFLVWYFKR